MHADLQAMTLQTQLGEVALQSIKSNRICALGSSFRAVVTKRTPRTARHLCMMATCDVVTHIVHDDGQFPNCSIQNLPVLIYKSAFPSYGSPSELANTIEETFTNNGYPPQWRFGLYEYPHYHSTSHEILGVFKGSARVRLGGEKSGVEEDVGAGDVMVIPAGVAHESVQSQGGFEMVGAYPAGYNWDMNYGKSQDEKQKAEANIKKVEIPTKDPVYGSKGPVLEHWTKK